MYIHVITTSEVQNTFSDDPKHPPAYVRDTIYIAKDKLFCNNYEYSHIQYSTTNIPIYSSLICRRYWTSA